MINTGLKVTGGLSILSGNVYCAGSISGNNLAGGDTGDVTLAAVTDNYLTISNQVITVGAVPVVLGGTAATTASLARANLGCPGLVAAPSAKTSDCARVGDIAVDGSYFYICHTAGSGTSTNRWHRYNSGSNEGWP